MKGYKMNKRIYTEMYGRAGDAFMAGHLGEWVNENKSKMTKSQLSHLVGLMENWSIDVFEGTQDPDKMAKHLNMIFEDLNK